MLDAYDIRAFKPDYCQADVEMITAAIKGKSSLLAIGMPGCGKSRLIDFIFNRPDVLARYGLPVQQLKVLRIDCDIVAAEPSSLFLALLQALAGDGPAVTGDSLSLLKNRLSAELQRLDPDVDLVIIFDNFNQSLQQALGEDFFNFLYALRNSRPRLNISYIFMANLKLNLAGFYKLDRLFDQGADRSIRWLSLLNRTDTEFSIERQLRRIGADPARLTEVQKKRIYQLGGGHALLTRYLSHLMAADEISVDTEPERMLEHGGIRAACEAIWQDLEQTQRNLLIDLANGLPAPDRNQSTRLLRNYGLLQADTFFSPLFAAFVKNQEKTGPVVEAACADEGLKLTITTDDRQLLFSLTGLSRKKRVLFCYLVAHQNETCSKDRLIDIGWPLDHQAGVDPRALGRQIEEIRKWLSQRPQLSRYLSLETVWGEGYKLATKG
jgi:hypothetical protein